MRSLRIAVALPHLGVYGGIRRFLELGEVWTRRGHEVALLTPCAGHPARTGGGPAPAGEAERTWLAFSGSLGSLDSFRAGSWDVLLSPDPALFAACRTQGVLRVFYSVLEGAPFEREALRSADLVLANSAGMRRYLARKGVSAHDASGGVNVEWYRPPGHDRRTEGSALVGPEANRVSVNRAPVRVLLYGRLSRRRKGTWTAVRAVERAAASTRVPVE